MTLAHESSYKIPENLSEHVFTDRVSYVAASLSRAAIGNTNVTNASADEFPCKPSRFEASAQNSTGIVLQNGS